MSDKSSLALYQGGLCAHSQVAWGYDVDYAITGAEQLFEAFGSLDGNSLIYGFEAGGSGQGAGAQMPVAGMSVATNSSNTITVPGVGSVDTSSIHIWAGAEIVESIAYYGHAPVLEPNAMVINSGDVIANPHPASVEITGIKGGLGSDTPVNPNANSVGGYIYAVGKGFVGSGANIAVVKFENQNSFTNPTIYKEAGGFEQVPNMAQISGPYRTLFNTAFTPGIGGSVFFFQDPQTTTTLQPTWDFLSFGHLFSKITVDPVNDKIVVPRMTSTTQAAKDNSVNVATTGYVDAAVAAGSSVYAGTTAAASNCNGGGTMTGVVGCTVVTISGTTHYLPYF